MPTQMCIISLLESQLSSAYKWLGRLGAVKAAEAAHAKELRTIFLGAAAGWNQARIQMQQWKKEGQTLDITRSGQRDAKERQRRSRLKKSKLGVHERLREHSSCDPGRLRHYGRFVSRRSDSSLSPWLPGRLEKSYAGGPILKWLRCVSVSFVNQRSSACAIWWSDEMGHSAIKPGRIQIGMVESAGGLLEWRATAGDVFLFIEGTTVLRQVVTRDHDCVFTLERKTALESMRDVEALTSTSSSEITSSLQTGEAALGRLLEDTANEAELARIKSAKDSLAMQRALADRLASSTHAAYAASIKAEMRSKAHDAHEVFTEQLANLAVREEMLETKHKEQITELKEEVRQKTEEADFARENSATALKAVALLEEQLATLQGDISRKRRELFHQMLSEPGVVVEPWGLEKGAMSAWLRKRAGRGASAALQTLLDAMADVDGLTVLQEWVDVGFDDASPTPEFGKLSRDRIQQHLNISVKVATIIQLSNLLGALPRGKYIQSSVHDAGGMSYYKAVLQSCEKRSLMTDYVWIKMVGEGAFGRAHLCRCVLKRNDPCARIRL